MHWPEKSAHKRIRTYLKNASKCPGLRLPANRNTHVLRAAGADLLFVEAPTSKEEMIRINRELNAPTVAIQGEGVKTPLIKVKELESLGYSVVVYPGSALYAAAWAVRKVMEELLAKGTTAGCINKMLTFNDFNHMIGFPAVMEKEKYYYMNLLKKQSAME